MSMGKILEQRIFMYYKNPFIEGNTEKVKRTFLFKQTYNYLGERK